MSVLRLIALGLLVPAWACVPGGGGGGGGGEGGSAEADGDAPRPDAATCDPDCGDRICGDDGCGGTCGTCDDGAVCSIDGACVDVAATCGDGMCADGEDCATCPADCGQCCGNGACEPSQGESCATCAADCVCGPDETCAVEARRCVPRPPDAGPVDMGRGDGGPIDPDRGVVGPDMGGPGGPPRILTLNANRRTVTEGERVVLSAVVTDPDGIGDVIGGVLESPEGASYGAFVTAGEEGAYSLTLTWGDLGDVQPIDFAQGVDEVRRLDAVFYDQGGASVRQALEITLTCEGDGACDGACTDLTTTDDCGGCGLGCGDEVDGIACVDGACRCPPGAGLCDGVCVDLTAPSNCGRCGNACVPRVACMGGECVCEGDCLVPRRGEIQITEFMADPAAVTDSNGEWFEISNTSGRPLRMDGLAFGNPEAIPDNGPDSIRLFAFDLPADGRLVFGKREDQATNGGVAVDVVLATLSLRNTDDEIAIVNADGVELDRLRYVLPDGAEPGASWQLDPAAEPGRPWPAGWCQSPDQWPGSRGDRGSPRAENSACP